MLPLLLGGIYRQIITNIWLKSALASIFIQELGYKLVLTIISHDAREDMDMSEMEKNNKHLVEIVIPRKKWNPRLPYTTENNPLQ